MEEKLVELKENSTFINLKVFGYTEAGKTGGNSDVLKPYFDQIYAGTLIDEQFVKRRTPDEISLIELDIQQLQLQILENNNKINSIYDVTITNLQQRKKDFEGKLEKYIEGSISPKNMGGTIEIFDRSKFIVTSFFLLMLSVFIFFFYVAVVYKALFINPQDILNNIQQGNWGISLLPHWYEVVDAIRTNLMVIFAPFIFFGFGYAIHILLESEKKIKYVFIGAVVFVTFLLDYLLADQIHTRVNQALAIIGAPGGSFKDILTVLIMGFVVYVIWSIIFHYWMEELNKLNIPNRLRKLIKSLEKQIDNRKLDIANLKKENEANNAKISDKNKLLNSKLIPISAIIASLSEFSQGWFHFVSGISNNSDLLPKCTDTYNNFLITKELDKFIHKPKP